MNYYTPKTPSDHLLNRLKRYVVDSGRVLNAIGKEVGSVHPVQGRVYLNLREQGGKIRRLRRPHVVWFLKTGKWPDQELDHKDGDKRNDAFDNLEPVTHVENVKRYYNNGLPLYVAGKEGRYRVVRREGGRNIHYGYYSDLQTASSVALTLKHKEPLNG